MLISELFRTVTAASPDCVWDALTTTGRPVGYLYGMTVESDWRPDTAITIGLDSQWRLTGEVLNADRPHRLSYTLGDRPGDPSVYVTWEMCRRDNSTIIRLYLDDPYPQADAADDLEATWLPVLSGLVNYLNCGEPPSPQTTGA